MRPFTEKVARRMGITQPSWGVGNKPRAARLLKQEIVADRVADLKFPSVRSTLHRQPQSLATRVPLAAPPLEKGRSPSPAISRARRVGINPRRESDPHPARKCAPTSPFQGEVEQVAPPVRQFERIRSSHWPLTPDSATTFAHLLISLRMKSENCAGVIGIGSAPILRICSCTSGLCKAVTIASLSRAMASPGVPAGATNPNQPIDSYPGSPASANVGTSGKVVTRVALDTANILICLLSISEIELGMSVIPS